MQTFNFFKPLAYKKELTPYYWNALLETATAQSNYAAYKQYLKFVGLNVTDVDGTLKFTKAKHRSDVYSRAEFNKVLRVKKHQLSTTPEQLAQERLLQQVLASDDLSQNRGPGRR